MIIATGQLSPTGIAVDATDVYWANQGDGTVVKCPRSGCAGASPTVLASGQPSPRGVAVDSTTLYWMTSPATDAGSTFNARVVSCPKSGCTGSPTLIVERSVFYANDVHIDGDTLYYTAWPEVGTCPKTGCPANTPTFITSGAGPMSVEVAGTLIYLSRFGSSRVESCTLPACNSPTTLVSGVRATGIAIDGTSLFATDYDAIGFGPDAGAERRIVKCPIAGCGTNAPVVVESGDISPYAIAVDAERLFHTNFEQGTVVSLPK